MNDVVDSIESHPAGEPAPRRTRRVVAAGGALAVVAVVGGGVWASQALLARGAQAADALPSSTIAYVSVDLDPSGQQKIEAARFFGRFPSLPGEKSDGDLREQLFDLVMADTGCDLKFADVRDWAGERFAAAVVGRESPEPVVVLEIGETAGLERGLEAAEKCAGGKAGHAVRGDWAVLARTDAVARSVLEDGATSPLTDDADFREWTAKAGEPGIVTLYAAPEAGPALVALAEDEPIYGVMATSMLTNLDPVASLAGMAAVMPLAMSVSEEMEAGSFEYAEGDVEMSQEEIEALPDAMKPLTEAEQKALEEMTPKEVDAFFAERYGPPVEEGVTYEGSAEQLTEEEIAALDDAEYAELEDEGFAESEGEWEQIGPGLPDDVKKALNGFRGMGGALRFDDGALELTVVADHLDVPGGGLTAGEGGDDLVDTFPAGSAIALGAGLDNGWAEAFVQSIGGSMFGFGMPEDSDEMVREFERSTGLAVPEDLKALGGDGFAVVLPAGFDPERMFYGEGMPVAFRVNGDPAKVEASLEKLKTVTGPALVWQRDGDDVLVGMDAAYLSELAGTSGLAGSETYQQVLPDAKGAASLVFVDFDAGDWLVKQSSTRDRKDVEPLSAVGVTRTIDGDDDHMRMRLALD